MRIKLPQPTGLTTFCDLNNDVIFIEPNVIKAEELLSHVKADEHLAVMYRPRKIQSYVVCNETVESITALYKRYIDPSIDTVDPTLAQDIQAAISTYNQKNRRKKDQ